MAKGLVDLVQSQLQLRLDTSNSSSNVVKEASKPLLSPPGQPPMPAPSSFTLELLGGKGFVDRVIEAFVSNQHISPDEDGILRELILQHSHPDGFDTSVFASLGMALDGRRVRYTTTTSQIRPKLRLALYQPVLSEAHMWTLAQGIGESYCLRELDLSSNRFPPLCVSHTLRYLADGLQRNKHLVSIKLRNCNLVDEQIVCLMEGLKGHPTLQDLNVAENKCRAEGLIAIASALSSTSPPNSTRKSIDTELPTLSLDLSSQHVTNDHRILFNDRVIQAWSDYRPFMDRIMSLNLSNNKLGDTDLSNLLSLLFVNTTTDESQQQGSTSSRLSCLDLSCNSFTNQGINSLVDAIKGYRPDYAAGHSCCIWKTLNIKGSISLADDELCHQLAAAMKINVYLEEIMFDCPCQEYDKTSLAYSSITKIRYYLDLNKGGRKVLDQRYQTIPLSLWPVLLGRANNQHYERASGKDIMFLLLSQGSVMKDCR